MAWLLTCCHCTALSPTRSSMCSGLFAIHSLCVLAAALRQAKDSAPELRFCLIPIPADWIIKLNTCRQSHSKHSDTPGSLGATWQTPAKHKGPRQRQLSENKPKRDSAIGSIFECTRQWEIRHKKGISCLYRVLKIQEGDSTVFCLKYDTST